MVEVCLGSHAQRSGLKEVREHNDLGSNDYIKVRGGHLVTVTEPQQSWLKETSVDGRVETLVCPL